MTSPSIMPILMALLAPSPAEPASEAASPSHAAPEGEDAPEAVAPETPPEAPTPEATPPAPLENPFAAPPPTTAVKPPPAATVAPPLPPRPIRWRLDFAVSVGSTVVRDLGLRAFTERRNLLDTGVSTVFDFRLAESRFFLGGGVAYEHVGREGDAHGSLSNRLQLHEPHVLGRVSFMVVEGIDVSARVGVGPSIVDTRFRSEAFETATQRNVIPRVDGRAGLSLYLPKAWLPRKQASRVSAGLDLGLGYAWRGKIDVQPALYQDDDPLRATTAPWGTLSLHGLSWGVGLFLRVM